MAPLVLLFIGGVEIYCMVLLVKCVRTLGGGSYGEIAGRSMGALGTWAVDLSILFFADWLCGGRDGVCIDQLPQSFCS